ncbi:cation:proton antiporter [Luteococcus sanguinis]
MTRIWGSQQNVAVNAASITYLVAGFGLLLAAVLPASLRRFPISAPMVLVGVGVLVGLMPVPHRWVDPIAHRGFVEHLAEVVVLISLMGVGIAIDRPLRLRSWRSVLTWGSTWRLLLVAMPLTIAGVALAGNWLLGLGGPAALLLGAALAPTDPVLASDVQVEGPTTGVAPEEIDEEQEVRFALTAEAGLNDGAAFPFVFLALLWAGHGHLGGWLWHWAAWDLLGRVALGVGVGVAIGWVLGMIAFRAPRRALRTAHTGEPFLALACLALAYGTAELVHGYGFIAVFFAAVTVRWREPGHEYHELMHQVVERLERLGSLLALLLLGIALSNGLLARLTLGGVLLALLLVFVIRPLAGWVSLSFGPNRTRIGSTMLTRRDRAVISFFGVRGIGTVYYLAFATGLASFGEQTGLLWSTAAFTIILSVLVHGLSSGWAMQWVERGRA